MGLKIGSALVIGLAAASLLAQAGQSGGVAGLRSGFRQPPAEARPMVRWWWFGVAVEKPELLRELRQMKADGIGGVELAFVYPQVLDDPAKGLINLPFLSPQMLDAVSYAQREGRRLGLRDPCRGLQRRLPRRGGNPKREPGHAPDRSDSAD